MFIVYTDEGRLDTVIGLVGGLVGLADIVLWHVNRQPRGIYTFYSLGQVRQIWQGCI